MYNSYATKSDLATFLFTSEDKLPGIADRLLSRASELIQHAMLNNYNPSNLSHVEAAKLAVCAQVEAWLPNGDSAAITGQVESYSMPDVSVKFSEHQINQGALSMRARSYLNNQGLLYRGMSSRRSGDV